MKLRNSVDPITLILSIAMGLQLIIIGLYTGLLVWPFYSNGLHMQPAAKVYSGSFDPKMLPPFCYTPPDAPRWYYSRCADGARGNPWGDELHGWAMLIAWLGPVLLIVLDILVGILLNSGWSALRFSERAVGLVQLVVSLGVLGFLVVTRLGGLLLVWILD
jgi:hypothetical protein